MQSVLIHRRSRVRAQGVLTIRIVGVAWGHIWIFTADTNICYKLSMAKKRDNGKSEKVNSENVLKSDSGQKTFNTLRGSFGNNSTANKLIMTLSIVLFVVSFFIFGASVYLRSQLTISNNIPNELQNEVNYWKAVVGAHPDYQDGWLKLAAISYSMEDSEIGRQYLGIAELIDSKSKNFQFVKSSLGE